MGNICALWWSMNTFKGFLREHLKLDTTVFWLQIPGRKLHFSAIGGFLLQKLSKTWRNLNHAQYIFHVSPYSIIDIGATSQMFSAYLRLNITSPIHHYSRLERILPTNCGPKRTKRESLRNLVQSTWSSTIFKSSGSPCKIDQWTFLRESTISDSPPPMLHSNIENGSATVGRHITLGSCEVLRRGFLTFKEILELGDRPWPKCPAPRTCTIRLYLKYP